MDKANVRQRIQMRALRYLLKTHAGPITSEVPECDIDTYWIEFTTREKISWPSGTRISKNMVVEREPDEPLRARPRKLDGEEKEEPKPITGDMIDGAKFEIKHFYKDNETDYSSPLTAALARRSGVFWLLWVWHRIVRANASRNTKLLRERTTVLEAIIKLNASKPSYINSLSVAVEINGPNFRLVHENKKAIYLRHLNKILESLEFTEEIKRHENREGYFIPTGKSMASLLEWERESLESIELT